MPISGLIITLVADPVQADQVEHELAGDHRYTLGQRIGQRLPLTLSTSDRDEDKVCWELLQAHPGITFVDVACVFFDDQTPSSAPPASTPHNPERIRPW